MDDKEILEKLLMVLPHWNYRIVRPARQLLDGSISMEMYYCLQILRWGGEMTMGDFARRVQMPKHQTSKMASRLFERHFIERIYDPADRRVVKIKITDTALQFINGFLEDHAQTSKKLLERMPPADREAFGAAVDTLLDVFSRLPEPEKESGTME